MDLSPQQPAELKVGRVLGGHCARWHPAIHKPPHQQHRRDFPFQPFFPSLPTPGYTRQRRLTPHPARELLAPALTDGDTHPLHTSPSSLFRGDSTPAPMTCFPLTNPRTCCPTAWSSPRPRPSSSLRWPASRRRRRPRPRRRRATARGRVAQLRAHSPRAEYNQHAVLERLRSGPTGNRLSRTSVLYNELRE